MLPVREDLDAAVSAEWERLSRPGTWWTAAERVAVAAETRASRSCPLCRERRAALSPYTVSGHHRTGAPDMLPPELVDAVHRIATDSGRLSRRWYREIVDSGISEYHFVETVAIVAMVTAVDTLARAIGCAPPPLPEPQEGSPSQECPAGAEVHSAWVPTVVPEKAQGDIARYYEESPASAGFVVNMQKPLTLVPQEQLACTRLGFAMYLSEYEAGLDGDIGRAITRAQADLLGATVSVENECRYCTVFLSTTLYASAGRKGLDPDIDAVIRRDEAADVGIPAGRQLRRFARAVVASGRPGGSSSAAELKVARAALREAIGAAGVVDAAAVIAHVDKYNRIASATGTELDEMASNFAAQFLDESSATALGLPSEREGGRLI